jgi:hypothetical protein
LLVKKLSKDSKLTSHPNRVIDVNFEFLAAVKTCGYRS